MGLGTKILQFGPLKPSILGPIFAIKITFLHISQKEGHEAI